MPPTLIINPRDIPQAVLVDEAGLQRVNPQRFEMSQLTGITLLDDQRRLIVGFKDVRHDEFWVKGHMPGYPLMPGVLMCEAAAQLCAFYCVHFGLLVGADFVGFGGMDEVRFRGVVRPGERLWIVGQTERHSTRRMEFQMQGFVGDSMVFNGNFIGVPMTKSNASADSA